MALRAVEHNFTGLTTPIASYDSTKTNLGSLMIQKTGINPEDNFVGPFPISVARPMEESTAVAMMYPHVIQYSPTIDWVFLTENLATASAARRIFLYEYNKSTAEYNWKGFITATLPSAANANTTRGFKALRYLHTTGTVAVAAPVSVYSTGSVAVAVTGVVTGTGTTFAATHVGLMIGFGSTNVALINCWHPIVTFTSTTSITVFGASNVLAAGTTFVIASCVLTGTGTQFTTDLVAAGTASTSVLGGLGPRIGFGSTDPTLITTWYHIGRITNDTSINLTTSPGVIPAGTSYVIEELRFALAISQATAPTNGGLFLLKGAGYHDFTTAGNTFPAIASAVTNQRGVYWLADTGTVTNTAANGLAVEAEISKTVHWAYVLDGTNTTNAKFYKYNLRANDAVAAGKMTLVSGTTVIITGTFAVTGTIPNNACNNCDIATALHGPGASASYLYFVTNTRIYCAAASGITTGSTTFITASNARQEIPPGSVSTFAATASMQNMHYISEIDHFFISNFAAGSPFRHYVSPYPTVDTYPLDHVMGVDDKQQDQSLVSSRAPVHFNTKSQLLTTDSLNGVIHITTNGTTAALNQMYAIPIAAHWTYGYTTSPANHQRVITPSISTAGCVKFDQVLVYDVHYVGQEELAIPPESFRVYYRTTDINTDATSSWTLLSDEGDLSGVTAANAIQFMLEFSVISNLCVPARIMKIAVTYEDGSTDSHYQLSNTLSNRTSEIFAWKFTNMFGGTVPTLKIELFNAETNSSVLTDTTVASANGTWEKSINGGSSWIAYNTTDKANEQTYIRYTPSAPLGSIMVRALLTQN